MSHPDFAVLTVSWELALRADGYADKTVRSYQNAVRSLAGWLAEHHRKVGPTELERQHIRGWLVEVRERHSSNTARGWFAGVRHFCRWMQSEGETDRDATAGMPRSSCCSWTAGCASRSWPASRSPTSTCATGSCT